MLINHDLRKMEAILSKDEWSADKFHSSLICNYICLYILFFNFKLLFDLCINVLADHRFSGICLSVNSLADRHTANIVMKKTEFNYDQLSYSKPQETVCYNSTAQ